MTEQPEPVCKSEQGCHRVVPCIPGCGAPRPAAAEQPVRHRADTITDDQLDELYTAIDQATRNHQATALGANETISYWKSQATDAREYGQWRDRAHASTVVEARRQAARAEHAEASVGRLYQKVIAAKEQTREATVAALNLRAQTPNAAQATVERISKASSWGEIWTALGMYYGMKAEDAGLTARERREKSVIQYLAEAEHRVRQAQQRAELQEAALVRARAFAGRLDDMAESTVSVDDRSLYRALATDLRTALDEPKETTP